jgi:uncharacterized protein
VKTLSSRAAAVSGPTAFGEPLGTNDRISAIDILRGVAVLGILLVNIEDFGLPHADKSAPGTEWVGDYVPPDLAGVSLFAWTAMRALFEGKMRAIFSMLFGAGGVLLISRLENRGAGIRAAEIYVRRTLWLLLFGLAHAYLFWEGDILYGYALGGLFLLPFRSLSPRALVVGGALVLSLSVPRAALVAIHRADLRAQVAVAAAHEGARRVLSKKESDAAEEWQDLKDTFHPDADARAEEVEEHRGGYGARFARRAELVAVVESSDYYAWAFFDTFGMMLVGMGLLRAGVLTAARSVRFYLFLAAVGFGVGLPIGAAASDMLYRDRYDPVAVAWLTGAYEPARLAVALAHIALVMLFVRAGRARWLASTLSDVGRMALTNYLTATVLCTTLFEGYGFGQFAALGRAQLYLVVLGVWCVQVVFSRLWMRAYRFGPAEWAWRSLTYWTRQPMRRAA